MILLMEILLCIIKFHHLIFCMENSISLVFLYGKFHQFSFCMENSITLVCCMENSITLVFCMDIRMRILFAIIFILWINRCKQMVIFRCTSYLLP